VGKFNTGNKAASRRPLVALWCATREASRALFYSNWQGLLSGLGLGISSAHFGVVCSLDDIITIILLLVVSRLRGPSRGSELG